MDSLLMEKYRSQLEVYAYLVETKLGRSVERLVLYFTSDAEDPMRCFSYEQRTRGETDGRIR